MDNYDKNQHANNGSSNSTNDYRFYEEFIMPKDRVFVFTERSFIHNGIEYRYSQLEPFKIVSTAFNEINGSASVIADGKMILFKYPYDQNDRFLSMMNYANSRIDKCKGVKVNYKFAFNSGSNYRIEVFDDYIKLYRLDNLLSASVANTKRSGVKFNLYTFDKITVEITNREAVPVLRLTVDNDELELTYYKFDENTISQIVDFINGRKSEKNTIEYNHDLLDSDESSNREFVIKNKSVHFDDSFDNYNSYRKAFKNIAQKNTEEFAKEYNRVVNDITTFATFYQDLYKKYLSSTVDYAMDILLSEGVWTETADSFIENHIENNNKGLEIYNAVNDKMVSILKAKEEMVDLASGLVPELIGGGFGFGNAMKGIAKAEAFNFGHALLETGAKSIFTNLNDKDHKELYSQIVPDKVFKSVFEDFWNVHLTMIALLVQNDKHIWEPDDKVKAQANSIFTNLSHPSFPSDRKLEAFINVLEMDPYDEKFMKYLVEQYGDSDETKAITEYLGYSENEEASFIDSLSKSTHYNSDEDAATSKGKKVHIKAKSSSPSVQRTNNPTVDGVVGALDSKINEYSDIAKNKTEDLKSSIDERKNGIKQSSKSLKKDISLKKDAISNKIKDIKPDTEPKINTNNESKAATDKSPTVEKKTVPATISTVSQPLQRDSSKNAATQGNSKKIIVITAIAVLLLAIAISAYTMSANRNESEGVPPTADNSITQTQVNRGSTISESNGIVAPNILNMDASEAQKVLEDNGFRVTRLTVQESINEVGWGEVLEASIEPGGNYPAGTEVELYIGGSGGDGVHPEQYDIEEGDRIDYVRYVVKVGDGNTLLFRESPNKESNVLDKIENDELVIVSVTRGNWGHAYYNGKTGWVCIIDEDTGSSYMESID